MSQHTHFVFSHKEPSECFNSKKFPKFYEMLGLLKTLSTQLGYSKNELYQGYLREIFCEVQNSGNEQQKLQKMALVQI